MANSKHRNANLPIGGSSSSPIGVSSSSLIGASSSASIGGVNNAIQVNGVPGPVWHREYWDRFIRDQTHLQQVREYIHLNPVKAGLVNTPESWPWSSAYPGNANLPIGGDKK